jgi:hypothetical protein
MTEEEAERIVNLCVLHVAYTQGWIAKVDLDRLSQIREVPLADMVQANRMIAERKSKPSTGGSRIIHATCDDRLIAAIYVAWHYDADDEAVVTRPCGTHRKVGLAILPVHEDDLDEMERAP